ncbi:hypothetical protein [Rhizobacter fulvus]
MIEMTPWTAATIKPARIGWFNASMDRDPDIRRYWDGERWSMPVYADFGEPYISRAMSTPADPDDVIPWRGLTERSATWLAAELDR